MVKFKIVTVKIDAFMNVSVYETNEYDNISTISNKGGLRLDFKSRPKWIALNKMNDYSIHDLGKMKAMIFTNEYESKKILKHFAIYYKEKIEDEIISLRKSLLIWDSILVNESNKLL
jgi:hypothetical protein